MSSKIAIGTASTGPDDTLVAVDAYGTTSDMVLSKAKQGATKVGNDIVDSAKKAALDPKALAKAIKVQDGKMSLSGGSIKDILTKGLLGGKNGSRIGNTTGPNLTGLPGLSNTQGKLAEKYLADIIGEDAAALLGKGGKLYKIGAGVDTSTAAGLMKGIAKLADFPELASVADDHAILATSLAYLDTAISMGIPDAIDILLNKIKDDKRARQRLIANVRGAVLRADIATIKKIIEYIGARAVLEQVPDACVYILAAYNFPPKTNPKQYSSLRTELLGLLEQLDSEWDRESRNGVLVNKLDPFTRISRAAKTLLQLEATYDVPIAMAATYKKVDLNSMMRKMYPYLVQV